MKSKLLGICLVVLLLLVGFGSQMIAASAGQDPSLLLLVRRPTRTPTRTATRVPATRTPTPGPGTVTGSVLIHGGGCCVGGTVGSTISIDTAFNASSSAGAVTDMRVGLQGSCTINQDLSQVAWEPFAASKIFSYKISTVNWVGFYVSAQYRDAAGNISPVYCDDISVEGMPANPTTGTPSAVITPTPTFTPTSTPTLPKGT